MTTADYPTDTAESCLQSLKKEFSHDLTGRNFSSLDDYGLNDVLKPKLKMKFEFYNENSEMGSEKLLQFKSEMEKNKGNND